ncbi:MAG: hypothetical protein QOE90_2262 [Thermoplasmata archaeon]|nr:hypothetical protein [Thermoplasmata archaeon]
MDLNTFLVEFLVAGAVGGLVGIEREHRPDGQDVIAGVRTFPLISIAGFLIAVLAVENAEPMLLGAGLLGIFAFALMFIQMRLKLNQTGVTTPTAMIVTFLLGVLIGYGHEFEAVVVGIAMTFLLVTKRKLHTFVSLLDEDEILSTLQFVTVLFILLPITYNLPEHVEGIAWLGRHQLVDPFAIVLIVVFVSAISFASLMAMRQIGPQRGLEFSGLMGGLVNSEATTAGLAQRAREEPRLLSAAFVGAVLATMTMMVRGVALVAFSDTSLQLMVALVPWLLPVFLAGAFFAWREHAASDEPIPAVRVKNPFAILPALRFAIIYTAVSVLVALALDRFGVSGAYVAALGGFFSAGAVMASIAALFAQGQLPLATALRICLLANAASVLGKLLILRATNADLTRRGFVPYVTMTALGLVSVGLSFLI